MRMDLYRKTSSAIYRGRSAYLGDLCENLNKQRHEGKYCDIILTVNGEVFHAHKPFLAACSPYFDTMFRGGFQEEHKNTIDLSKVFDSGETLGLILDYIYTGDVMLTEKNYIEVLNGAAHFLIGRLRSNCAQFMLNNLGPGNCIQFWTLADMYDLMELRDICVWIARARFHDFLVYQQASLEVPVHFLKELVMLDVMAFMRTSEKVQFLMKWLNVDVDVREPQLRLILKDTRVAQQLGLTERDLQEDDTEERAHDGSDLNALLEAVYVQTEEEDPVLDDHNEALVGWYHKHIPDGQTRILNLYAYVPKVNRWWTLGKIRIDRHFGSFIGFADRQFLFRTNNGFLVVNSERNTFHRVGIPVLQRTSGIRSYSIFVLDGSVFCMMEISKYTRRNLTNGSHFLVPEARAFLKVYDFNTRQWGKVCDLPVPKQMAWLPLQFHVLPREDLKCVFVLAMSCANSMHVRGPGDQWRINGPYLLSVRKRRTKYCVVRLQDPPVTRQDLPSSLHSLRLLGTAEKIYLYGTTLMGGQNQEECRSVIAYDIIDGTWTPEEERTMVFPLDQQDHVVGIEEQVPLSPDRASGIQSLEQGLVYHLKTLCPFVTKFRARDFENGTIRELPSPPTDKLKSVTVCYIPRETLAESCGLYRDKSLRKGKSPFAVGRLRDHPRWDWQFRTETQAGVASPPPLESDDEIDVES